MNRRILLLALTVLAALAAVAGYSGITRAAKPAATAPPPPPGAGQGLTAHSGPGKISGPVQLAPPAAPNVVLYDQYDNDGANAVVSSVRNDSPTLTSQIADDFVVPAGQTWTVNEVDARGYPGIPMQGTANIYFYQNTGTLPGTPVYTATNVTPGGASPDYLITLPSPATLTAGTYWVSVQANMTGSNWFWGIRTVQSLNPAAFREGGGFGTGCNAPAWFVRGTCTTTTNAPDQMYRLVGTVGGGGTPTPTGSPTTTPTRTSTPFGTATATPACGAATPGPWTAAAPYPITDVRYGFAQVGNSFYVIGGVSNGTRTSAVNRYDVATGTWTALAPIPVASEAPTCAYNSGANKIFCAEGDTGPSFQIYNIATNTWTTGPAVPGAANR